MISRYLTKYALQILLALRSGAPPCAPERSGAHSGSCRSGAERAPEKPGAPQHYSTGQILCLFLQILQKVVLLKLTSKEEHFQKKIMTNDRLAKYEGKNLRRTISSGAGLQG